MNNQRNSPACEPSEEHPEPRETGATPARPKKQFVEPVVSAPVDVLEATAYFLQAPTLSAAHTS